MRVNEKDLFNQCIHSLESELIETRHEIESLKKEVEAYEKVIQKLKDCLKEY